MATKRDYYDVLGVSKNSSASEVKSAYRKKALEFHPDRNKASDAETKFKEVNEAYEVLSNPQKKQTYDQFGHSAFDPASGGPQGGNPFAGGNPFGGGFSYTVNGREANLEDLFGGGGGFSDPFNIFESFFGGSGFSRQQAKPHYSMRIEFMDAIKGVEKSIIHQGKSYIIKVPAGADTGTRIRFKDFDVSLEVHPHKVFKREGYDVVIDQEVPFTTAILGGEITIPTLSGKDLDVKIRPGTQFGSVIRLSGQGVKDLHSSRHGDFYIRLNITLPQKLSRVQKSLLEQFESS